MSLIEWLKWRIWWLIRPKYLVGVFMAVVRGDEILLVNKKRGVATGWMLPGGGLERKNLPASQALYELAEETGIWARDFRLVSVYNRGRYKDFRVLYLCTDFEGKVEVKDKFEIAEARFVPIACLKSFVKDTKMFWMIHDAIQHHYSIAR